MLCQERNKHPKKLCIKNFGGTLAGGQGGGLGAQILYVGVGFPSRIQCIKNFEGGGLRGSWGWRLRSNFAAPFLYVYVLFWGLALIARQKKNRGRELNTNLFFLANFSGAPGIAQAKSRDIPAKKCRFPGIRRTYRTFWPPPLHVEGPHPIRRNCRTIQFGFGFLFLLCKIAFRTSTCCNH